MTDGKAYDSLFHILVDHWELITFLLGAIIGSIVWAMHRVFATKAYTDNCKLDLIQEHEKDLNAFREENKEQHEAIRTDVNTILNHLLGRD